MVLFPQLRKSLGNNHIRVCISLLPTSIQSLSLIHVPFHTSPTCPPWGPISVSVYMMATTFWSPASVALKGRSPYLSSHYHQEHIPQTLWTCPIYFWGITHFLQIKPNIHYVIPRAVSIPWACDAVTSTFMRTSGDWWLRCKRLPMCKVPGSNCSTTRRQ